MGETEAAEATQGLVWTGSSRQWGHCRLSFRKSYDQSCASGREQCANKDLKQYGSDRYKEGPKWKKSRVLSPSGHSLCSQIHALTAKQNLKAKTTQPHNHSFFIFFGCTVWLVGS